MNIVIPEDNSKWGVAPKNDIFQSFRDGMTDEIGYRWDIDRFFREIERISNNANINLNDTNYKEFKNDIKKLQKYYKNNNNYTFMTNKRKNGDWWRKILNILNPNKNGFKLMNTKQLYNEVIERKIDSNIEIWTDSSCVFIEKNEFVDFFVDLDNQTGIDTLSFLLKKHIK